MFMGKTRPPPRGSAFESEMASICGKEAAAFVITGTMANQLALRNPLNEAPPYAIMTDAQSRHTAAQWQIPHGVGKHAVLAYDVHKAPTRVVSIENTNSGTAIPLEELQHLHAWAQKNHVSIHIDGARLFDAVTASGSPLRDFAQCADLLTLDFSNKLGAPIGAMVLGSAGAIQRLKRTGKGIGGGMRQAGVLASAARQAVVENFGLGAIDSAGVLARSHGIARLIGQIWTERGGNLLRPIETNVVWVDLSSLGVDERAWTATGKRHGILMDGKRIMIHHQIFDEAVMKLQSAIAEVLPGEPKMLDFDSAALTCRTRARL